jgi:hypothetical protein
MFDVDANMKKKKKKDTTLAAILIALQKFLIGF